MWRVACQVRTQNSSPALNELARIAAGRNHSSLNRRNINPHPNTELLNPATHRFQIDRSLPVLKLSLRYMLLVAWFAPSILTTATSWRVLSSLSDSPEHLPTVEQGCGGQSPTIGKPLTLAAAPINRLHRLTCQAFIICRLLQMPVPAILFVNRAYVYASASVKSTRMG